MSRRVSHVLVSALFLGQTMAPVMAADTSQVNFKIFSPPGASQPADAAAEATPSAEAPAAKSAEPAPTGTESMWTQGDSSTQSPPSSTTAPAAAVPASPAADAGTETPKTDAVSDAMKPEITPDAGKTDSAAADAAKTDAASTASTDAKDAKDSKDGKDGKTLQGYIRVVPSGTKLPIIMDSAVDSDTSQEGDEFAARTSEDLTIDGSTVVPAGSVIKGRIARINAPKHLDRSGSVGLKFDTITTPDNKQIALSATLVARGGVVHARRGLKDVAMDTGVVAAPLLLGAAIGAIAGGVNSNSSSSTSTSSSSKIGLGGGLLIGVGIGAAVGVIILCAKKGKRVDMRPGDELKIELAEDLRMPM